MNNRKLAWLAAGFAGAAGLYILGTVFQEAKQQLGVLAGVLVGWLMIRRPGDSQGDAGK